MKKSFIILAALFTIGVVKAQESWVTNIGFSYGKIKGVTLDTLKTFTVVEFFKGSNSIFYFDDKDSACKGISFRSLVFEKTKKVIPIQQVGVYTLTENVSGPIGYTHMIHVYRMLGLKVSSPEDIMQKIYYLSKDSILQEKNKEENLTKRKSIFLGYLKGNISVFATYNQERSKWELNVVKEWRGAFIGRPVCYISYMLLGEKNSRNFFD